MGISLEYLAGFFDGEGCVSLSGRHWQVTATQTVKNGTETLEEMMRRWGGYIVKVAPRKPTHNECWHWKARGLEAAVALHDMAPFLRLKRKKATRALLDLRTRQRGKIGRVLDRLGEPASPIWASDSP